MEITKREGECDEATFWSCVAEIGWPVDNTDIAKSHILRAWTPEFGTSFRKVMTGMVAQVYAVVQMHEKTLSEGTRGSYYLSDDGLSDFCNHVVGMGWATFQRELADPDLLIKRAAADDYQESFSYAVPYEPSTTRTFENWAETMGYDLEEENFQPLHMDARSYDEYIHSLRESYMDCLRGDWRKIEPDHYAKMAEQYLPGLAAFLASLENTTVEDERMAVEYASVLVRYFNLLINEKTDEAIELSEGALEAWWTLYHIAEDIGALRSAHKELLPMVGNSTYGGENLINDHREFMAFLDGFKCQFHLKEIRRKTKEAS